MKVQPSIAPFRVPDHVQVGMKGSPDHLNVSLKNLDEGEVRNLCLDFCRAVYVLAGMRYDSVLDIMVEESERGDQ